MSHTDVYPGRGRLGSMAKASADGGLRVRLFGEAYIHNSGGEMSMTGGEGVLTVAGHAINEDANEHEQICMRENRVTCDVRTVRGLLGMSIYCVGIPTVLWRIQGELFVARWNLGKGVLHCFLCWGSRDLARPRDLQHWSRQ